MPIIGTRHRPFRRAGTLTAALLLAGCGGASHQPQVASLPTHGSAGSHRSASTALSESEGVPDPDGRPREPLNATTAQAAALYDPYLACLRAHKYIDQSSAKSRLAVVATCEHLEPLPPWQVDPSNPQARAFIGRTVTCLEARGYHARADLITTVPFEAPFWYINYSPSGLNYSPQRPTAAEDTCHQQALR
jgi:hypothetical protein